ncbi:response regulator [Halanaerocella petrolearia]
MSKKVMIVDDSKTIRTSVKYTLSKEGYEVVMAENGQVGLEKLRGCNTRQERPNMIITDVNMPQMDGISFTEKVKEDRQLKFIPILILTTESQAKMKTKGKEAGAAGWLVKPFDSQQLINVVKKFVK